MWLWCCPQISPLAPNKEILLLAPPKKTNLRTATDLTISASCHTQIKAVLVCTYLGISQTLSEPKLPYLTFFLFEPKKHGICPLQHLWSDMTAQLTQGEHLQGVSHGQRMAKWLQSWTSIHLCCYSNHCNTHISNIYQFHFNNNNNTWHVNIGSQTWSPRQKQMGQGVVWSAPFIQ